MEVTQGVSMMSNVAVSVCILRAKLRGQQLAVCHQSWGPSTPPAQMFQVVDGLIEQSTGIKNTDDILQPFTCQKDSMSCVFSQDFFQSELTKEASVPPKHAGFCPYCLPSLAGWSWRSVCSQRSVLRAGCLLAAGSPTTTYTHRPRRMSAARCTLNPCSTRKETAERTWFYVKLTE